MPILILLFLVFAKFGLLCFGGGNVLTPLYIEELVQGKQWLSLEEFGNLLAIAQMTPGPISVNAATFFGFKVAGPIGAAVATIGLLIPSFILMCTILRMIEKMKDKNAMNKIMWGVGPATIGLTIVALLIFLEMSVFTTKIPWTEIGALFTNRDAIFPEDFKLRPFSLVLTILSTWALLSKRRVEIMTVIFVCAVLGAIVL